MLHRDEVPNVQNAASYLGIQELVIRCSQPQDADRDADNMDPRSPLSPDDYEPLEPIEDVEERERLREEKRNSGREQEGAASADESQSTGEQTGQSTDRSSKPRTRLYEQSKPRGRGRGRGRPRGRPRVRPLSCDRAHFAALKSSTPQSSAVRRGTGRPRGRPRIRPLPSETAESTSTEESTTVANDNVTEGTECEQPKTTSEPPESATPDGDAEEVNTKEGEAAEDDEGKTKPGVENTEAAVVVKRGRGRPRIKPLPSGMPRPVCTEKADVFPQSKEKEGVVRKRGRPRIRPLSDAAVNTELTAKLDNSNEEEEEEHEENGKTKLFSSDALDDENPRDDEDPSETSDDVSSSKKVRTSNRKRSLSRKLRESQASNEEQEEEEAALAEEEWDEEEEVKSDQNKLRPICNICGNLFSEMSSLRRHMRIHKGIKPYQCQLCGRCFRQGNQLKTHMRVHTGMLYMHTCKHLCSLVLFFSPHCNSVFMYEGFQISK